MGASEPVAYKICIQGDSQLDQKRKIECSFDDDQTMGKQWEFTISK